MTLRRSFQLPATVHGHCELEGPDAEAGPRPLVVGFHGYAETAERHLQALRRIPGIEGWRRCAVQALHPFYRGKTGDVGASWMTRFNRELAITDNIRYVAGAVARIREEVPTREPLAWVGFSQGTAMAYRAAAGAGLRSQVLIALGGDVHPDLAEQDLPGFPRVLIGRGRTDPWYSEGTLHADVALLEQKGVTVEVCLFDGGHEWSDVFCRAAGRLLESAERSAAGA
jgi:predicted esterase